MARSGSGLRRRALLLSSGSAVSGLLAFVFFATVTHTVGAVAAAPFAILWAFWAYASAGITFPLQHWTIRSVTSTGGESVIRRSLPLLAAVAVGLAVLTWLITFSLRSQLFGAHGEGFALMAGLTALGAAAAGVVRGVLTARESFGAVAVSLALENAARVVIALVLAVRGEDSVVAYGVALLGGYIVAVWPSAWRLDREGGEGHGPRLGFLASTSAGQLMGHVVLTSGPVVLALGGGAPEAVTSLFAALALFRAPYLLMLGAVAGLTGRLTRAFMAGEASVLAGFRRSVAVGSASLAGLGAVAGGLLGPWVLGVVYGADVTLDRVLAAVVAAGCVLAMGNLLVSVLLLSVDRASRAFPVWVAACVPGALGLLPFVGPGSPSLLLRVCLAFLVVEIAAFGGLLQATVKPLRLLR